MPGAATVRSDVPNSLGEHLRAQNPARTAPFALTAFGTARLGPVVVIGA